MSDTKDEEALKLKALKEESVRLAGVLADTLRTIGDKSVTRTDMVVEALRTNEDRLKLADIISTFAIGFGPGVYHGFGSYLLRHKPTEEHPKGELDVDQALAMLLLNEVIFTNEHHWEKAWPKAAQKTTSLSVNCNDLFAWGCADAESMHYEDIETVYEYWEKDPQNGTNIWVIIKRGEMPQSPIEKRIRDQGIWDLDALQKEHNLLPNWYDNRNGVEVGYKYEKYSEWAKVNGLEVLPFDVKWWTGWKLYTDANPNWQEEGGKAEIDRRWKEWRIANGWGHTVQPSKAGDPVSGLEKDAFEIVNNPDLPQAVKDIVQALWKKVCDLEKPTEA